MIVIRQEQACERIVAAERANTVEAHAVPHLHRVPAGRNERGRVRTEAQCSHIGTVTRRGDAVNQFRRLGVVHLLAHLDQIDLHLIVLQ